MRRRVRRRKYRSKSVMYGPSKKKRLNEMFKKKKKSGGVPLKLKSVQVNRKPPASTFCFVDGEPSEDLRGYGNIEIRSDTTIRYKHPERDYYFSYDKVLHTGMGPEEVYNVISRNVLSNVEMGRSCILFYVVPTRFVEEQNILVGHPSLDEEEHENGVLSWIVSELLENKKQLLDISELELRVSIAQYGVDQDVMENCEHYNVTTRIDRDLESVRDILIYSQQRIESFVEQMTLRQYRSTGEESDGSSASDTDEEEGNNIRGLKKNRPSVIYEIPVKTVSGIDTQLIMVQLHQRHFRAVTPMVRRYINTSNYNEDKFGFSSDVQAVQAAILRRVPGTSYGITVLGHAFQDKSRMCKRAMEITHKCHRFKKRRTEMTVYIDPMSEHVENVEKEMKLVKMKELSNGIRKDLISLITNFRDTVIKKEEEEEEDEGETDEVNYKQLLTQVITETIPGMYQVIENVRNELSESQLTTQAKEVEKEELKRQIDDLEDEVDELKENGPSSGSGGAPEGWISPDQLQQFIATLDQKTQEEREEHEEAVVQWKAKCDYLKEQIQILQEEEDEEGLKNQLVVLRQAYVQLKEEYDNKPASGEEVAKLEDEIGDLEDEKEEMEEKYGELEEQNKENLEEIQRLRENIGDLERVAFERRGTGDNSAEQWEKMYQDKVNLQNEIYQVKLELHELKVNGMKVPTENEKAEATKKKKKSRGDSDSEMSDSDDESDGEEERKVSQEKYDILEQKYDKVVEEKTRAEEELNDLIGSMGRMKDQLDSTQEKVSLYDEAIEMKRKMENDMKSLKKEKSGLEKKLDSIESQTRQKLSRLKKENDTIMERVAEQSSEFEEKIQQQRREELTLKNKNHSLSKKVESYESKVRQITEDNERQKSLLKNDVLRVNKKLSTIQDSISNMVSNEGRRNKIGKKKIEKLRGNYLSELEKLKIRFKKELYFKVKAYHKEREKAAFLRKAKKRQDQENIRLRREGQMFKKRVDELEHKIRQMKKGTALFANNPAVVAKVRGNPYLSTPIKRKRGGNLDAHLHHQQQQRSPPLTEGMMSPKGLLRNEKLKKRVKLLENQLFELQLKYNGVKNKSPMIKKLKQSESQQKSMLLHIKKLVYFVEKFKQQKLKYERKCNVYKKLLYERDRQLNTIKSISTSPPRQNPTISKQSYGMKYKY